MTVTKILSRKTCYTFCPGQSAEMCWRIFVVLILEDFPGDFPGGFFWALFPTKMRRKNPARKSAKKSGGSKLKIREKSVLPKAGPNTFGHGPRLRGRTLWGGVPGTFWKPPSQNSFSEPLPRSLFYCKNHRKTTSRNPSENPSPEPFPEPSQNPS